MTALATPTFYAQNYATSLQLALQQQGSLLQGLITVGPSVAGFEKAVVVDRIEAGTAQAVSGTLQDKVYQNPTTSRLWVQPSAFDYSQTIDTFEALKMLSDPASKWVMASMWALGRAIDEEINAAMWRATTSGQNGGSTAAFDTTNQRVAVNHDASGNVGLTVAKLKEARRMFLRNKVDLRSKKLNCVITSMQDKNLLNEAQYINLDYGDRPVLEDGQLKSFLGMNFTHYEDLDQTTTPYRRVPVFTEDAIELRYAQSITTSVNKLTTKRGEPYEVYAMATFGAARTDDKLIVDILCNEA